MPATAGRDEKGCFMRWGNEGKKYYYECGNDEAKERARQKAIEQGKAIKARGE